MGIDARLENERGHVLGELIDPTGRLNWLLALVEPTQSVCLRFIDPYGQTIFNRAQIGELRGELEALRGRLSDERLRAEKQKYLHSATNWPAGAKENAARYVDSFATADLNEYLSKLLMLISEAESRGPHHYVRFLGD